MRARLFQSRPRRRRRGEQMRRRTALAWQGENSNHPGQIYWTNRALESGAVALGDVATQIGRCRCLRCITRMGGEYFASPEQRDTGQSDSPRLPIHKFKRLRWRWWTFPARARPTRSGLFAKANAPMLQHEINYLKTRLQSELMSAELFARRRSYLTAMLHCCSLV